MKTIAFLALLSLTLASCSPVPDAPIEELVEEPEIEVIEVVEEIAMAETEDIKIFSPLPGENLAFPVLVSGEARGFWYSEAVFTLSVLNEQGIEVHYEVIQADGDWMTEDFVPFSVAVAEFDSGLSQTLTFVFQKANPSGLPENAETLEVEVQI